MLIRMNEMCNCKCVQKIKLLQWTVKTAKQAWRDTQKPNVPAAGWMFTWSTLLEYLHKTYESHQQEVSTNINRENSVLPPTVDGFN